MQQAGQGASQESGATHGPIRAWRVLPFLVALLILLRVAHLPWTYQSSPALVASSLLFAGFLPLLVAMFAAWTFLEGGRPSLLLLACGALAFSVGSMAGPLAIIQGSNALVTIQCVMVLLSATCHFASALTAARPGAALHRPWAWLSAGFLAILVAAGSLILATVTGHLPTFFIPGQGGTPIRNGILGAAIALFATTGLRLRDRRGQPPSPFLDRYSFALALVATGLFGVLLQSHQGSLLSWTGRAIYYSGGVAMLFALAASAQDGHSWSIPLGKVLRESEARFRNLVAFLPDAVIVHRDGAFLYANPAALQLYGAASLQELQQRRVMDLVAPESRALAGARIKCLEDGAPRTELLEQTLLRLDGTPVPAEIAGINHWHQGQACILSVLRDISARRQAQAEARRAEEEAQAKAALAAQASQLQVRNEDLERFTRLSVGREFRMIELKKLINDLSQQLGRPAPYPRHLPEGGASRAEGPDALEVRHGR